MKLIASIAFSLAALAVSISASPALADHHHGNMPRPYYQGDCNWVWTSAGFRCMGGYGYRGGYYGGGYQPRRTYYQPRQNYHQHRQPHRKCWSFRTSPTNIHTHCHTSY